MPLRCAPRNDSVARTRRALPPPRLDVAHHPMAEAVAAGFALHPGLALVAHPARQEITALDAVVAIGRGERRDGAVGAGERVLPVAAGLAVALEQRGGGGARRREISVGEGRRRRDPPGDRGGGIDAVVAAEKG